MTLMQRLRRVRCWFRGYHVYTPTGIARFRFDRPGRCYDCGPVGTGIPDEPGE